MVALRLSITIFSYAYIVFYVRERRVRDYFNMWTFSVLLFWSLYLIRLFFDVYVSRVSLALPAWELVAWSLGSSLPIAICSYILASQQRLDLALIRQIKYGVFSWYFNHLFSCRSRIRSRSILLREFKCYYMRECRMCVGFALFCKDYVAQGKSN